MLAAYLRTAGYDVDDHGAHEYDRDDDFPEYALETAQDVVDEPGSFGVVIGGSGNGENIAANKVPGVRSALAWNVETARLARHLHNANVIAVGARMQSVESAFEIVSTFLNTPFSGMERHQRRLDQISRFERGE
jgi:ribose 5-phosphate isomerase B